MRVPLSWIREFTDCRLPVEEIAERLTMGGLEVEATERLGVFSDEVRVAEVLEVEDLPGSRELRVVELGLADGDRKRALTGAPNVTPDLRGSKVPAALPGARLIDPKSDEFQLVQVEEREILGIRSEAVLCSAKELGISADHSGVLLVEGDAQAGRHLREYQKPGEDGEADIVLEVAILPNYGRCLSIIGMARELSGLTRCSFRLSLPADYLPLDAKAFHVEIADPDLCRRYSAHVLHEVEVKPSPRWLQRRLVLAGLKPINNVVDVTNYIMVELGQPMHAFDLERLPAPNICVRRARPGEKLYTLDQKADGGEEESETAEGPRGLDESVLLITSGDKPVAVAGVIGGLESQIEKETRAILLESANFDFIAIRRAMGALRLTTDAAARFSREVDPSLTVLAIQRAVRLLRQITNVKPAESIADCYPRPLAKRKITINTADICRTLGVALDREEIAQALERLGFTTEPPAEPPGEREALRVEVPGFRPDVTIPADLAEEVIRVIGFDRLESRRLAEPLPKQQRNLFWELRHRVRELLVGCNLQDVITYSLTTPQAEARLRAAEEEDDKPPYVSILNPSSRDRSVMRRTLLGGLLETVARNHRHRPRVAVSEIGLVFLPESGDRLLPEESLHLAIAVSGPDNEGSWIDPQPRELGFYDVKGIIQLLLDRLHVTRYSFARTSQPPFHPGVAAELRVDGEPVGALGQLHPLVRDAYELGQRVVVAAELDLRRLLRAARFQYAFESFSRFPSVNQDLALEVDDDVPAEDVVSAIRNAAGPLLVDVRLFDVYRGKQLGEGKKSLAFQLTFCAQDRSLSESEVNALRDAMLGPLESSVGAKIR